MRTGSACERQRLSLYAEETDELSGLVATRMPRLWETNQHRANLNIARQILSFSILGFVPPLVCDVRHVALPMMDRTLRRLTGYSLPFVTHSAIFNTTAFAYSIIKSLMQANPRIPLDEDAETPLRPIAPRPPAAKRRGFAARIALVGVVMLAIVGGMFFYAWRVRQNLKTQTLGPGQFQLDEEGPESALQISDPQMVQEPAGPLDIYGRVLNAGTQRITRAVVQLTFKDAKGRTVATIQKPIHGKMKEQFRTLADDFPLEPGQSRFFQVSVNQLPAKWNHEMPELKVITVSVTEPEE